MWRAIIASVFIIFTLLSLVFFYEFEYEVLKLKKWLLLLQ